LETAVELLDLPAYFNRVNDHLPVQMRGLEVGNDPFNAAVWGNQLEELNRKRHLWQPHLYAPAPATGRGRQRVERLLARFFVQAHEAVAFQGGEKGPSRAVKLL
jgi:hypothetical protein